MTRLQTPELQEIWLHECFIINDPATTCSTCIHVHDINTKLLKGFYFMFNDPCLDAFKNDAKKTSMLFGVFGSNSNSDC